MVWIHGGGFFDGNGKMYNGTVLANMHDIVVVTINYRLGAFGFLTEDENGKNGNVGLFD